MPLKPFVLGLLLGLTSAYSQSSAADTILPEVALGLHAIDYLQTRRISANCSPHLVETARTDTYIAYNYQRDMTEINPLLGNCPSIGKVNLYFAITGITLYTLSKYGPEDLKPYILGGWLTIETITIGHNYGMGIRLKWN